MFGTPASRNPRNAESSVGSRHALHTAVRQSPLWSRAGLSERLFSRLFTGLVYPQIWEDPEVDMAALRIRPEDRLVTIASGGCNALSYLVADPKSVEAVDLNAAHVALNRLKLAALARLPDYDAFYRFHGDASDRRNIAAYRHYIRAGLDEASRVYWERRDLFGRRRISFFARNVYRRGLLGLCITWCHRIARLYGTDPRDILKARTIEEQRAFFDLRLAPIFEKRLVRWVTSRKASLFGLGIPPQQYDALAGDDGGLMAAVLRQRLQKLACDFPLSRNYFASQAFGRGYGMAQDRPLPPYLSPANFDLIRARTGRMSVLQGSYTAVLAQKPSSSVDCFILLDAQDWMSDAQLNDLWCEITRTAAPGARVIFRTAAEHSILPGRVHASLLQHWTYRRDESQRLHVRDRSSIYGGFHLYTLEDAKNDRAA